MVKIRIDLVKNLLAFGNFSWSPGCLGTSLANLWKPWSNVGSFTAIIEKEKVLKIKRIGLIWFCTGSALTYVGKFSRSSFAILFIRLICQCHLNHPRYVSMWYLYPKSVWGYHLCPCRQTSKKCLQTFKKIVTNYHCLRCSGGPTLAGYYCFDCRCCCIGYYKHRFKMNYYCAFFSSSSFKQTSNIGLIKRNIHIYATFFDLLFFSRSLSLFLFMINVEMMYKQIVFINAIQWSFIWPQ